MIRFIFADNDRYAAFIIGAIAGVAFGIFLAFVASRSEERYNAAHPASIKWSVFR